jgi:hypothetical protein
MRQYSVVDPLARALLSGFVASAAAQLAFGLVWVLALLVPASPIGGIGWAGVPLAWLQALRTTGLVDLTRPALYQALGLYFVAGVLWAVFYTHVFDVRMTWLRWERGLVFACIPWLFSSVFFLPVAGGGLFGFGFGAGPLPVIGSLALHAVYGVVLTRICGPLGSVVLGSSTPGTAQLAATHNTEAGAAAGVVAGVVLGAAFGLTMMGVLQAAGQPTWLGMHPLGILTGSNVCGGAFGGVLGSFLGLARAEAGLP